MVPPSEAEHPQPLIELTLRAGAGADRAGGAAVEEIAAAAGVEPERLGGLRELIEELIRESLGREHAGPPRTWLQVTAGAGRLEIELRDEALPVSSSESRRAPARRIAALGCVDELHIAAHGRAGNLTRCMIALPGGQSQESVALAADQLADEAPAADEQLAAGLEVRPMEESDARGLIRCVYRTYGYSYKSALMYEPREIVRALRRGLMHSVVAVTPAAGVIGHSAVFVEREGDRVPESGRLVVDPRFRGHGVANRMAALRRELAAERGLPGFWSEAVTNHPYSQREIVANGGAEVGLLIGASPPTGMVGFADGGSSARHTLVATYTPLNPTAGTIHPPARHAEMIDELAQRLGLEREVGEGEGASDGTATHLSSTVEVSSGLAHLRVVTIGADLAARVAVELDSLEQLDIAAVHLDLPLSHPAAAAAAEALEPLGFCFAAWIPRFAEGSDGLRLQRTGSHPVETGAIACARPEGEVLRDYVLADWHRVRRGGAG